ncbi:AcrR family transcriptional regulator [Catenulispora sp. GP43]|uniref:TetR/AcrR family transcriptional regulator n=1 Tax=Catenulispora sp. GP43 TaxID=3156263 RepID=UPI003513DE6A
MHRKTTPQVAARPAGQGRARDSDIDARILAAAKRQLAVLGYEGMSIAAVAAEAGTTRQALYRRWPGKAELADAAVASVEEAQAEAPPGAPAIADPFAALVAELTDFQQKVSRPGRLSLVGTMLQESTDLQVRERYRARVIHPRRQRLTAIFEAAQRLGLIDQDADLAVAVTMCTGGWYGRALAGEAVPADWPVRAAVLVWRAVGGDVDEGGPGRPGTAVPRITES